MYTPKPKQKQQTHIWIDFFIVLNVHSMHINNTNRDAFFSIAPLISPNQIETTVMKSAAFFVCQLSIGRNSISVASIAKNLYELIRKSDINT